MRTRWSPSAIQSIDTCARRFALREAGWQRKPDLHKPEAPHAEFGRVWHASAEVFDQTMFHHDTRAMATDRATEFTLASTDGPAWGVGARQWRCAGGKVPSDKTGKPVQCPASKGWWIGEGALLKFWPQAFPCPKCGGPTETRHAYLPYHNTKNRMTLLRAVVDYCDEALPGVAPVPAGIVGGARLETAPGLEIDLPFRLAGIDLHCILDRYTAIGPSRLAHERKTSSRPLKADNYMQTFQVRFYPEALHQNGLRCDGVLLEHYQIFSGGTQRSTATLTPTSDHVQEAVERLIEHVNIAEAYEGHDPLDWPGRMSACSTAAGGNPCEFLKVCTRAQGRRPEVLRADFEQKERET